MSTRSPAPLLVLGAIVSVQCGGALATKLFDDVGPGGAVLLRLGLSAIVLLVAVRPSVRGRSAPHLRAVVVFGCVLAGMNACFYQALARTPLGIAVTVEFVGPLAVAALTSRRRLDLVWLLLAAAGVILLAGRGEGHVTTVGIAFALAAGAFWAAYIFVSKRIGVLYGGVDGLALALAVGTVAVLPYGVADGGSALLEPEALLIGLGVAMLSSVVPYTFELVALRTLPAGVFGVLMSLEPAAASVIGLIALDQSLAAYEVLAVGLVVVASLGVSLAGPGTEVERDRGVPALG